MSGSVSSRFESIAEAKMGVEDGFADVRERDFLGFVQDRVFASFRDVGDGTNEFVFATERPHIGEALHSFLQLMAPHKLNDGNIKRERAALLLDGPKSLRIGSLFDTTSLSEHFRTGHQSIGEAVGGYVREVRASWIKALQDGSLDKPFKDITRAIIEVGYGMLELQGSLIPDDFEYPESAYRSGLYAAGAWRLDEDGQREFLGHAETKEAAEAAGIPILPGNADSYLGKLTVKHFAKDGEYEPDKEAGSWLDNMSLSPGGRKQSISIRELPVWVQLKQNQPALLGSDFIKTIEELAVSV